MTKSVLISKQANDGHKWSNSGRKTFVLISG